MAASKPNGTASLTSPSKTPDVYGGVWRFELELEFAQALSNPLYLHHLATQKFFEKPEFIAYLNYLTYFAQPPYLPYLSYPGPTLRILELLQQETFRRDLQSPALVERMVNEGIAAAFGESGASGL